MVADSGAPSQRRFSVCAVRIGGGAPKYALFFTFTSEAWEAMVENPRDRAAQARAVVEAADGKMVAIYWMFGPYAGLCVFDSPNPVNAGAASGDDNVERRLTAPVNHGDAHVPSLTHRRAPVIRETPSCVRSSGISCWCIQRSLTRPSRSSWIGRRGRLS